MHRSFAILMVFAFIPVLFAPAEAAEPVPLDHDVYTEWNRIEDQGIGPQGDWAFWSMSPEEADGTLIVQATRGETRYEIPRGDTARFTHDGQYLLYLIQPERELLREAKLDEEQSEESYPKPALGILDLTSGAQTRIERVRDYILPEEAGGWVAWRHAKTEEPEEGDSEEAEAGNGEEESAEDADEGRSDEQEPGTTLVLRNLATGNQQQIEHVSEYAFSPQGRRLAFITTSPDGRADGVFLLDTDSHHVTPLLLGEGLYSGLVFDESGDQLAFLGHINRSDDREFSPLLEGYPGASYDDMLRESDNPDRPDHHFSLYRWQAGMASIRRVADESMEFLGDGWHVSGHRSPSFSESGDRLFFGTAPKPVDMPDNEDRLEEEIVEVDIWHWQDDLLQPEQLERLEEERKRTYLAVAHLEEEGERLVQLGRPEIPAVDKAAEGDASFFLGVSGRPYYRERSWDYPWYYDAWRIDVNTGSVEMVLKTVQHRPEISPEGRYVSWWDRDQASWFAMDLSDRAVRDLGANIDSRLDDHTNDRPFDNGPYEAGVWFAGDAGFLLYDRFDVWRVDPASGEARMLSQGLGRERGWRYRVADLDPDEPGIDTDGPLLATTFDETSKEHGFARLPLAGNEEPEQLVMTAHHYGTPEKADDAEQLLFTRENFQDFPDLHVAGPAFDDIRRLSHANPQQAEYRWGQVELVDWEGESGRTHQGMLFRPEDFDPDREYPMIVYFYERSSDGLHDHRPPEAHRSVIIPTFYTSNDYIVFVPDVWYREGEPGESAMESIMPMTRQLAAEPWVDEDRIGLQGHSWAGYQIAYMVTQTDFFRAAAGGAPVANMTSAYGGIRWRSGMSRMFQYEDTQSRLGTTLWNDRQRYIDNSPIFMADQINTPLMMLHNDHDGAVPWEQGIELFTALRRLNRPAWLINYNNEPHWPQRFANREDWQIRLEQFFDHYLKDEPAPRWLSSGIPALEKGATLGREPE